MKASAKTNPFLTGLILVVLAVMLFETFSSVPSMKSTSIAVLIVIGLVFEYNRGYNAGKAFYTEENPELVAKASKDWDHRLSLREVLATHPFCLMELDHAPCLEHDYPLPSGVIHLVQNEKYYTTLTLKDDGWSYTTDSDINRDLIKTGKYQPMLTRDAMRISQDKIWDLYF